MRARAQIATRVRDALIAAKKIWIDKLGGPHAFGDQRQAQRKSGP